MQLRFKPWLLVAILAFAANFGVSHVAPPRDPSAIVHVLADASVAETVAELRPTPVARVSAVVVLRLETQRASTGLDSPLFQRPPPFFLSLPNNQTLI